MTACQVNGCGKPTVAKGLCRNHYNQQYVNARKCSVDGCERPAHGRGYCTTHYQRWKNTGDPTTRKPPSGPRPTSQPGDVHGRLTVIREDGRKGVQRAYLCRCECGTEVRVAGGHLREGSTRSCGCLQVEGIKARATKHGHSANGKVSPTYITWAAMRSRCYYPKDISYEDYGGRGITVCDRWRESFEAFLEDVGVKPEWATGGLDRIDNGGNYELGNVRWSTSDQQAANRRPPRKKS